MESGIVRKDTAVRLPVLLLDAIGAGKAGVVPSDVLGGLARVYKADGTATTFALTAGVNWFEIDSTNAPGLYHVLVPSGQTNVLGPMQVVFRPAASVFEQAWTRAVVEELQKLGTTETAVASVGTAVTAVSTAVSAIQTIVTALQKVGINRLKIHTAGPDANRLVIYDNDETTPLYKWNLKDASGNPTLTDVYERDPV